MIVRGIRGATTAKENTSEAILEATRELLQAMAEANDLHPEDFGSIMVTTTPDLTAEFPARAVRLLGWNDTAIIGAQEIAPPGAPERCIRVLIHWNTEAASDEVRHVYLGEAARLRPDRSG